MSQQHFDDEKEKYASPEHNEHTMIDNTLEGGNQDVLASDYGTYINGE